MNTIIIVANTKITISHFFSACYKYFLTANKLSFSIKNNSILFPVHYFSRRKWQPTLRNKRKLATLNKENCEEHPRSNLAQNSIVPRSKEDYITQVSEEIEGRVTKKLFQEISRTESLILGALSRLDDFLLNPLVQGHSETAPETSRNTLRTNQETNEDDSQSDPHSEASVSRSQTTQNSGPDDTYDSWLHDFLYKK